MTGFAKSDVAYTIDLICRRYGGVRPSEVLGYHPMDGRGLLMDIAIAKHSAMRDAESETVKGRYEAMKATWDKDTYDEVRRFMM